MSDAELVLREIARLGRQGRTRLNDFQAKSPCRWEPYTVESPETGLPFSDASAWQFICDLIEESPEAFTKLILRRPEGQIAFSAVRVLPKSGICVYIKVQLVHGKARGRSFHISTLGRQVQEDDI